MYCCAHKTATLTPIQHTVLGPISIILNFSKKKFGKSWHQTAFTKKIFEKF